MLQQPWGARSLSTNEYKCQLAYFLCSPRSSARPPSEQVSAPPFQKGGSGGFQVRLWGKMPLQDGPESERGSRCTLGRVHSLIHALTHPLQLWRQHAYPSCIPVHRERLHLCLTPSAPALDQHLCLSHICFSLCPVTPPSVSLPLSVYN